jgi:hypothetical protein
MAIYLISQAKTNLSALTLKRLLGVSYYCLADAAEVDANHGET